VDHWELADTSAISAYVAIARDKRHYVTKRLVESVVDIAWARTPEAGADLNEFELKAFWVGADAVRHFASSCLEPIMTAVQSVYDSADKEKPDGLALHALQQIMVHGTPNMDSALLLPLVRICWAVDQSLTSEFSRPEVREKSTELLTTLERICVDCCHNVGQKISAGFLKIENGHVVKET